VNTSLLAQSPTLNTFSIKLTDDYGLFNTYNGRVDLNYPPEFIKEPVSLVTVFEGGKI
jgi:hypothetical protein